MATSNVNHPAHYQSASGIEVIAVIEAFDLNFSLGNVIKYVLRAGHKKGVDKIEDLKKAQWYIARELENEVAVSEHSKKETK